jgi:hypothetical protein
MESKAHSGCGGAYLLSQEVIGEAEADDSLSSVFSSQHGQQGKNPCLLFLMNHQV